MRLNDIVDEVYFINLDRRPDRLLHVTEQLSSSGIVAQRFPAVDGSTLNSHPNLSRGAAGCLESQLSIIRMAVESGLNAIALFEDDVFFVDDFENKFSNFYQQVPSDWQFVYLANNKYRATVQRISDNVEKVSEAWSAHAFLIRRAAMEMTLDIASSGDVPIDVYYGIIQKHLPAYTAVPALAGQRPDHSAPDPEAGTA